MEESLSVILTTWKRNYLSIQLDALKQQSYPIKEIIVYQNDGHLNLDELKSHFNFKHIHSKDINFIIWFNFFTIYSFGVHNV